MKTNVHSPGSATVINAIAIGSGSAFGIGLGIECEAKTQNESVTCSNDVGADSYLMELCAEKVFGRYGISSDEFGLDIKTSSNLPMASGLSSSSALSNAVVKAASGIISDEFDLKPMDDYEIIDLAIGASLEAGVTITGAYDDATASYFGGVTLTDNSRREIIFRQEMPDYPILVYMPDYISESGSSDVNKMKLLAPLVREAFEMAKNREFFKALTLNGLLYSATLGFDSSIAVEALGARALASGLSGTGSSFVAVCSEDVLDDVKDAWSQFEGRVIETSVDNNGCRFI